MADATTPKSLITAEVEERGKPDWQRQGDPPIRAKTFSNTSSAACCLKVKGKQQAPNLTQRTTAIVYTTLGCTYYNGVAKRP